MVLSNATCTVYVAGTSTAATLYSDNGITPLANPFLSSSTGQVAFYAANGLYDLVVSKIGYLTVTISAIELDDLLAPSGSNSVGYLPAGTGAVATTVQTKLRESVSVKDFGAVGDGVTDDTSAIQTAITSNPGRTIFFPSGKYLITSTITIASPATVLEGELSGLEYVTAGSGGAVIVCNTATDAVYFNNTAAPTGALQGCGMKNLSIARTVHVATGSGLKLRDTANFSAENIGVSEFFICIDMVDAQSSTFRNVRLYTGNAFTGATNSTMVSITGLYPLVDPSGAGWINSFDQFIITSNRISDHGFWVRSNDDLRIANTYIGRMKNNGALIELQDATAPLYSINFEQVYIDGVTIDGTQTPIGIWVKDNGVSPSGSTPAIFDMKLTGCTFGQLTNALYIDQPSVAAITVENCEFHNTEQTAVYIGVTTGAYVFSGCSFYKVGYSFTATTYSAIKCDGSNSTTISGCSFNNLYDTTRAIAFVGTQYNIVIANNSFVGVGTFAFTPLYTTGATIARLVYGNNNSNGTDLGIFGLRVANQNNTDGNALDWYEEGTWTPALAFGGGSTGMTYSTRTGRYTRIGNRVFTEAYFQLSAKGSSTGVATITGMPFASDTAVSQAFAIRPGNMAATIGDTYLVAAFSNSTTIQIDRMSGGSPTQLADTDFTATSYVAISANYKV
jgi:hypothetical protein